MKQLSLLLLICLFSFLSCGQNQSQTSNNLNFEQIQDGTAIDWKNFGESNYQLAIDSLVKQSGNYSASIEFLEGKSGFKAWAYDIPAIYEGQTVKLTGYLKTENVTEGFAGLWMRIDPSVGFDNMQNRGIKGTSDWTLYEIELDLKPSKAQKIVVGGLLVGKGKMWIDQLEVTIDGKPLDEAPKKALSKAEQDQTFDEGSKIESIVLTEQKTENLKVLGMVWGFLKYYHPNIAKGDYNWDYELFRILPEYLALEDVKTRDAFLVEWIDKLGAFQQAKKKKSKADIKLKPDLVWIKKSKFSKALVAKLKEVQKADRTNNHYYIGLHPSVENPNFKHENSYSSMKYPDAGFRLLSVYRYWNIIQYYFPYKHLIAEDWKTVLPEFIPKFINAKDEQEYKLAALELIARIHDTHANIWSYDEALNQYWGKNYAALELKFIENKAIVSDYFDDNLGKATGLNIGDEIIKINQETVPEIIQKSLKYTPASNYPTQLRDIAKKLLRSNDSLIHIEYMHEGQSLNKTIKTYSNKELDIYKKNSERDSCFKFINEDIAYLYLGSIKSDYIQNIFKQIKDTKGLVIDLRCYPSEFVVFTLGQYLMPDKTAFVKFTSGNIQTPGQFSYTADLEVGVPYKDYYKGKVAILVNETTQSQAEYTTMAYRVAPQAKVFGSTTAAADGNISVFYLPGNIRTMISGIGVYYPDNKETQRVGILPDVEIKPTVQGFKAGKDEVLDKALEWINE